MEMVRSGRSTGVIVKPPSPLRTSSRWYSSVRTAALSCEMSSSSQTRHRPLAGVTSYAPRTLHLVHTKKPEHVCLRPSSTNGPRLPQPWCPPRNGRSGNGVLFPAWHGWDDGTNRLSPDAPAIPAWRYPDAKLCQRKQATPKSGPPRRSASRDRRCSCDAIVMPVGVALRCPLTGWL